MYYFHGEHIVMQIILIIMIQNIFNLSINFLQVCFNDLLQVIKTISKNVMKFIKTKMT